jgi:hypothetical protein
MALRGALRARARALAPLHAGSGAASTARLAHGGAPAPAAQHLSAAGVRPLLGAHPRVCPAAPAPRRCCARVPRQQPACHAHCTPRESAPQRDPNGSACVPALCVPRSRADVAAARQTVRAGAPRRGGGALPAAAAAGAARARCENRRGCANGDRRQRSGAAQASRAPGAGRAPPRLRARHVAPVCCCAGGALRQRRGGREESKH